MIEGIYEKWMNQVQREKIRKILLALPFKIEGRVLDLGSGPGFLEEFVPAIALDVNPDYLKKIPGVKVLASGNALPFKSNTFDLIFCIDTAHLLRSSREIFRVLKPGGKCIASIFCSRHTLGERRKFLLDFLNAKNAKVRVLSEFVVKTEEEWDYVIVAEKCGNRARNLP